MGVPLHKNNFGFIDINYENLSDIKFTGGLINLETGLYSNLISFDLK